MRNKRATAGAAMLCVMLSAIVRPGTALAAADGLDAAGLGLVWALPFVGILLSIALGPLLFPSLWQHHLGKLAFAWAALTLVPLALAQGPAVAAAAFAHTMLLDYVPFIILLFALFTCAGGILLRGNLHGSPGANVALLAVGTVLASLIGTTGASVVMIRPVLRANDDRRYNVHVVVFFIFLVANIGGSLTPLGDPPLFLGFLKGVDFFWTTRNVLPATAFAAAILLALFYGLDTWLYRKEKASPPLPDPTPDSRLRLQGIVNLVLIGVIIAAILVSARWKPGIVFPVAGAKLELQNIARDVAMLGVGLASLALTPRHDRKRNGFAWSPIVEVAKIFAGIFIAMIPVLAILKAGREGAFAPLVALVTDAGGRPVDAAYFWLTGGLSSFLDNAPTYLLFFQLAGGDAERLMNADASTLVAISTGAVFMGANSYIGNAPNFMVYAIARGQGVAMPSFFGYMLWSGAILVPLFIAMTFVFFI